MAEENTAKEPKELFPEEIKKQEDAKNAELEKQEAEHKRREFIEKKIKECEFEEVDALRYSFVFGGGKFIFRIPKLFEKTQIKLILSQITSIPGTGLYSSTYEIMGSGDFDLICSTKLLTHVTVLMDDFPKDFDAEKLDDNESFELGQLILLAEGEFLKRKKKASSEDQ